MYIYWLITPVYVVSELSMKKQTILRLAAYAWLIYKLDSIHLLSNLKSKDKKIILCSLLISVVINNI